MCHAVICSAAAVCCSCVHCGAVLGGALFGAWGKWDGGKEALLGVLKDTNGSGQRHGSGAGAKGQRHGSCEKWQRHGSGIRTAAAAAVHRPRQKPKKWGGGEQRSWGGSKKKSIPRRGVQRAGRGGTLSPYISEMIIFA